jgi:hypothetical protein
MDLVEVRLEERFEAPSILAASERDEAAVHPCDSPCEDHDDDEGDQEEHAEHDRYEVDAGRGKREIDGEDPPSGLARV